MEALVQSSRESLHRLLKHRLDVVAKLTSELGIHDVETTTAFKTKSQKSQLQYVKGCVGQQRVVYNEQKTNKQTNKAAHDLTEHAWGPGFYLQNLKTEHNYPEEGPLHSILG